MYKCCHFNTGLAEEVKWAGHSFRGFVVIILNAKCRTAGIPGWVFLDLRIGVVFKMYTRVANALYKPEKEESSLCSVVCVDVGYNPEVNGRSEMQGSPSCHSKLFVTRESTLGHPAFHAQQRPAQEEGLHTAHVLPPSRRHSAHD